MHSALRKLFDSGRTATRFAHVNAVQNTKPEVSFLRALLFSVGYFAILLPSLSYSWNQYIDMVDPPFFNPQIIHSFWLSGLGGCLWFGATFAMPAAALVAFCYVIGRVWKLFRKT